MGNQAGIIIRNVKNELFHSATHLILNEVKGIECLPMLLTGNHDYSHPTMPYRNAPISIEDGAWIGAQTTVCPGVKVHRNAILTVGSVATKDMEANGIYQGNPAVKIRERRIKTLT